MLTEQEKKRLRTLSSEERVKELYLKVIPVEDRAFISGLLEDNMHVADYDGKVKYKIGQAPGSIAALEENRDSFPPGVSGNEGRKGHRQKPLQRAFRELLEQEVDDPVDVGNKILVSDLLAKMQLKALVKAFSGTDSLPGSISTFSRLLADFRIAAGEVPTQATDNTNRDEGNPYLNASVQELVKVTQALLERANTSDKPPNKEIAAIVSVAKVNDNKG